MVWRVLIAFDLPKIGNAASNFAPLILYSRILFKIIKHVTCVNYLF